MGAAQWLRGRFLVILWPQGRPTLTVTGDGG